MATMTHADGADGTSKVHSLIGGIPPANPIVDSCMICTLLLGFLVSEIASFLTASR